MTRQRPLLIAVSCLALACPIQIQLDLSQRLSIALAASTAMAKEGNNGNGNSGNGNGGSGNGNGNGNSDRSGNSGNSGSTGNANGNGNGDGGSKGGGNGSGNNGNGNGNGGSKGNAGGNGADTGNGGGKGNGNGNGNGNQGNSSNSGQSNGQGQSSGRGTSAGGSSGQKASDAREGPRSSQSPVTGGLSALFGAIAASLRPPPPEPAMYKRTDPRKAAKAKTGQPKSAAAKGSQPSTARSEIRDNRTKADRTVVRSGRAAHGLGTASPSPAAAAYTPAGSSSSLPKPARAERSIVAAGLSPLGVERLRAQGFRTKLQTRGILASVIRLLPPRGMSLNEAQRKVRMADAGATADFDHFYYTDEGQACTGPGCEAVALIGWNMPPSRQCGPAPTIGLIDTGIERNHEALQGQSIDVLPMPQAHGASSQRDHGTAVAALLVGRSGSSAPGLLPGAKLVAVDAFYRDGGTADRTDVASLVAALEALSERNVRIVNLSLSGPPNEVLKRAIASAQEKGLIIVAAAGNNGPGAAPSYPAAYPGVIAVTAVDRNLAIYSRATQGEYVDLAAPGVDLWVAAPGGGGTAKSGTSYAVPFISAAAAVLSASEAAPDTASVRKALEGRTLDLGKPGRDKTFGYGLLQAANLCQPHQDETPVAQSATAPGIEIP